MPDIDTRIKAVGAVLVVLCGLLFYRMRHPATTFAADGMDSNWDAAVQRSHGSGQPTVVLFTANWCSACQSLHRNVLSRGDVQGELQGHYNVYTVDLSNPSPRVQAHAHKFGVEFIPLMIRYDANGIETDRTNSLGPAEMMAWLKAGE